MARRSSSLLIMSLTVALAALALCAGVRGVDAQATNLSVLSPETASGRTCEGLLGVDLPSFDVSPMPFLRTSSARACGEACRLRTSGLGASASAACSAWVWVSADVKGFSRGDCLFKLNLPASASYTPLDQTTAGYVPAEQSGTACPATDLRVTSPDTAAGRLCDGMANFDLAGYDAGASYNRQTSNARDCSEQCRIKTSLVGTTPCSGWAWVSAGPNAGLCTFKVNVPLNANYTAQANRTSGFVPAGSYACPTPAPAPAVVSGFSQLTYLGCWGEVNPVGGDNNLRLLPRTASDYRGADPIGNCLAFATSQGDTYFGLQYGYQCWSGSKYQRSDLPFSGSISSTANSGCSMTCPGAPSLNCGGSLANQVYSRRVETCAPFAWSASTTGASSSLALGNSSAVTPSWSVACFSAAIGANVSVSCATNFKVGLYDSASGELVKTLFASPSYCPRAGQVDVGSSFGAPDGSYAGRAFYLQATHVVGSAVVTLGAPLRYTVVCSAAGSTQASPVSLPGLSYTGALSGSSSEFLYAQATLPFTSAADLPVGGQFSFTLDNGASCSSPSSINGSLSVGSCRLSTPTAAGFYNVAVRFEAQTDSCTLFVAQTSVSIQVLDLQVLQAQADATVGALNAEIARASAAEVAVQANVVRETARAIAAEVAIQQNFTAGLAQAAAARAAGDAALAAQLSAEVSRANATELELRSLIKDLTGAVGALTARVTTLERPAAYLFFGLANALSVSYPRGQQPGSGPANMLRKPLIFDTPLSSLGDDSLTYSPTTGQLRITAAGTYRFDAFVHLFVSQGNTVGTGVVSWQTAAGRPIGPNVLNENSNGVAQGVPGDDSLVSSLRTISASELPFTAQLVLVSMNQREATITDASVISVTRVR